MSSILVFRTECYKILHRRQSLILLLPALLAFLIVLGQAHGVITLAASTASAQSGTTLLDTVFLVWSVESGLGFVGLLCLLCVLFASLSFAGEREGGQIKLALLRIGKRRDVVLGKFLAIVIVSFASILLTLAASALGYLFFAPEGQRVLSGACIYGLSLATFAVNLGLNLLELLLLLALTFLLGLYAGPFVTFVLTMIVLYGASTLAGGTNLFARLLPLHWANTLILGENAAGAIWSVLFAVISSFVLLALTTMRAQRFPHKIPNFLKFHIDKRFSSR